MSKIAIDARGLRGTTGRYFGSILEKIQDKVSADDEFHVIINQDDQGLWYPQVRNFYLHVVSYKHYSFGEQIGFARFLYKLRPDLVHFCFPQQPLLYFGRRITNIYDLTLVRFRNIDKNPLVYWMEQRIFIFLLKNVARRSLTVIVDSRYVKDDVVNFAGIDPAKVTVVYGAAIESSSQKLRGIKELAGQDFLLYVGNAFPHKNLKRLVDAHQQLLKRYPKLQLAIAGKKEFFQRQLAEYIKAEGYIQVHQLGYVSDEQLAWLYKRAAAYVFPSLSEGFGLPGLEVMQHDTPLVSSKATCLPEVYGEAAHYFDPENTNDMVRAIDEVLRSKKRCQDLVRSGHQRLQRYSWDKSARQVARLYEQALNRSAT